MRVNAVPYEDLDGSRIQSSSYQILLKANKDFAASDTQ